MFTCFSGRWRAAFFVALVAIGVASIAAILCGTSGTALAAAPSARLTMGDESTLLIKSNGALYAWGSNYYGQLGLGSSVYRRARPTPVGDATDWKSVAAGASFAIALKTDGSLWAFGSNDYGQLGLGDTDSRFEPTRVGTATDWSTIAVGLRHAFALKTDGTLWAWGRNDTGELGLNDRDNRLTPTQVGTDADWAVIDGGGQHTVAIKTNGTLWAWGRNNRHQLGLTDTLDDHLVPTQVGTATDWKSLSSSDEDVRALKTDGSLWAWGYNFYGQLGLGDLVERSTPTKVSDGPWDTLACGDDSTLATKTDNTLWTWGDNTYGQLGQNDHDYRMIPTQIGTATDWTVLASGHDHCGALKGASALWVWGKNNKGQLGLDDETDRLVPVSAFDVTDVTAPVISSLVSPTHPDPTVWYENATPTFSWEVSPDASEPVVYHCDLKKYQDNVPITWGNSTGTTWTAPETNDGVWYFSVRAGDAAGNWSSTSRRQVNIDANAPVTTDDAPSTPSKTAVTVHLTATDAGSGVAKTEYQLDGGAWTSGTVVSVSGEGIHTLLYRSTDKIGQTEADKSREVIIDTTAPVTSDDAPSGWRNKAVKVHLTASDRGGSGVAKTEYNLDDSGWKSGAEVEVSGQGVHTILYRSSDAGGLVEANKSCTVKVDTAAPTTLALKRASVIKGRRVTLRYRVNDPRPGSPTATVVIKIKTKSGKVVKQMAVGESAVNTALSYSFRCKLARRAYRFFVYATDAAGNVQAKVGASTLTVR